MAYPSAIYSGTSVAGTTLVSSADHASMHNNVQSEVTGIETVLGTTAGTSVLKSMQAGDFPARINTSNVLQQALQGTLNSGVFGTPAITGGTSTGAVTTGGTVNAQAGTLNAIVIGTPQITGGTLNSNTINSNGQNHITITPGTSSFVKMQLLRQDDTTATQKTGAVVMNGWGYIQSLNGTTLLTKAITFGTPFATAPVVVANLIGFKNGNPAPTLITQIDQSGDQNCGIAAIGTGGFTALIRDVAIATSVYWGLSWVAIGVT